MSNISKEVIDKFVSFSSFSGLKGLYIYYKAYKTGTPFLWSDLEKKLTNFSKDYTVGFLDAISCMQLVNEKKRNEIISIIYYNDYLGNIIEKNIKERATEMDSQSGKEILDKYSRVKAVEAIEKYFSG